METGEIDHNSIIITHLLTVKGILFMGMLDREREREGGRKGEREREREREREKGNLHTAIYNYSLGWSRY